MSGWQAGIDVGGTNTDVLMVDIDTGAFRVAKVPSTPDDPSLGVIHGLEAGEVPLSDLTAIVHGTTIATNAVLERKGARCGLITTRGFRDILELGRRTRPNNYGMTGSFEALIDRELRLEVTERIDARGREIVALNEAEVRAAVERLRELDAEAVVIHFLHSYANSEHEQRATEIVRSLWPNDYVTSSSDILCEVREFERGSTAAVNAFVQPLMARYLGRVAERLEGGGFPNQFLVMQGNGGTMSASMAARQPVQTVMSGPAAGAIAAAGIGQQSGFSNLIACDIGGTSFDVTLILDGNPALSAEKDVAYGVPVRIPMIDTHIVGAGGGSIARVDAAGLLRVGPESAGAVPGPVCYGHGGQRPTMTDANVVLGRVDPTGFSGNLDASGLEAVKEALDVHVGQPLGLNVIEAASALLAVSSNQLASAIRLVSIEKGHDPRDFALFAFGGAGPMHGVALARELGIPTVLVPRFPGITSALGCVMADLRHDFVHTFWQPLAEVDTAQADAVLADQAQRGRDTIVEERVPVAEVEVVHEADLLYRGQTHVFRVPVTSPGFAALSVAAALTELYEARFGIELIEMTPVLASLRTTVIGRRPPIDLTLFGSSNGVATTATPVSQRPVFFTSDFVDTPIYDRDTLNTNDVIDGPAIIQQPDTTVVIDPGATAKVDSLGNLVIDVEQTI